MDRSFWAGIAIAETASQLAIGGLLLAGYRQSTRRLGTSGKWLGPVWATVCTSLLSGSVACASLLGQLPGWLATLFALGVTGFTLSFALAVGRPARLLEQRVYWLLLTAMVGLLALGFTWFPLISEAEGSAIQLTALGRAWFIALVVAQVGRLLFVGSLGDLRASEGRAWVFASGVSTAMFLLDALRESLGSPWAVPLVTHVGVPWILALGVVGLLERGKNLSQAAQLSAELVRSRDELGANRVSLERAQRELGTKKQLAAVGELAAAIAHEVRNPLAIIVNAAAGLRRPTLQPEDRNTLLGILDEESARLNRLVTDLLRFARPVIIKRSSVSIVELAKRVEGRLDERQTLSVQIPDELTLRVVQADANLLRLVFDNLVSNAFQAMPDGGTVRIIVSAEQVGDSPFVRVAVIDHGHGMDDQVRSRATDPFYTTRPSGTGLGLPIVERIVEAHGGSIEIDSAPGQGTTVAMLLPRLEPETTEPAGGGLQS